MDTVVQPDLMVVRDQSKVDRRGVHGAPDLVIEILSDFTRRLDCMTKLGLYQRSGVQEYWIVDPEMKIVLVYTLAEGRYHAPVAYNSGSSVPVGILEGCAIDLSAVFPDE